MAVVDPAVGHMYPALQFAHGVEKLDENWPAGQRWPAAVSEPAKQYHPAEPVVHRTAVAFVEPLGQ